MTQLRLLHIQHHIDLVDLQYILLLKQILKCIHYHNMEELNNDLQEALIRYTNMTIPELKEYVYMQKEKGMGR